MKADPYASKVLDPLVHARLVADLPNYAKDAAIQPHWIWDALDKNRSIDEKNYLIKFKFHMDASDKAGLCLHGPIGDDPIENRMSAIAGFLVRNFIRARVMTLGTLLSDYEDHSLPNLSCILVPNFFLTKKEVGSMASWQTSALYDLLTHRKIEGQQTIIYVSDVAQMEKEYGLALGMMVRNHFILAPAAKGGVL